MARHRSNLSPRVPFGSVSFSLTSELAPKIFGEFGEFVGFCCKIWLHFVVFRVDFDENVSEFHETFLRSYTKNSRIYSHTSTERGSELAKFQRIF